MAKKQSIDSVTRRSIELFLERIKGDYSIAEIWLYGSRARGNADDDSDADLAIVLNGPKRRAVENLEGMIDAEMGVLLETGRLVSPFPIALDDWQNPDQFSNPFLIANIKREGIRL